MEESKYDQYASMREYTQMSGLDRNGFNDVNERNSDESDADIVDSMEIGRGRKTANDMKQWIFVVKKTNANINGGGGGPSKNGINPFDETQPLINQSANDALDMLHEAQTRNTLEMDIRRTGIHTISTYYPCTNNI